MTARVVLHRDPRFRGSIGGRYYHTDASGRRWVVNGHPRTGWFVGEDVDSMTPEEVRDYLDRAESPEGVRGTWVSRLAEARAWLAENATVAS